MKKKKNKKRKKISNENCFFKQNNSIKKEKIIETTLPSKYRTHIRSFRNALESLQTEIFAEKHEKIEMMWICGTEMKEKAKKSSRLSSNIEPVFANTLLSEVHQQFHCLRCQPTKHNFCSLFIEFLNV